MRFNENIRGSDVFVVQSTGAPADNLMELLVMLDAAKRASARRVTAVMPYFGYARQDRKDQPRAPITAKLVANLITVAGADRALTMDLHSAQIQGFFDIPFDHLYAAPVLIELLPEKQHPEPVVVVAPTSAASRWRAPTPSGWAPTSRSSTSAGRSADAVEIMNIIGDVEGKNVVMFDDVVTTARTLCQAAAAIRNARRAGDLRRRHARRALRERRSSGSPVADQGAGRHRHRAARSGEAGPQGPRAPVAGLLGEAVQRIHEERSLSSLFV